MTITQIVLLILGGALAIEGFAWAVGTSAMRRMYHEVVSQMDDRQLGLAGLVSLFLGLAMIVAAIVLNR